MRIYEGSPRQDFEEVFRSIGAFLDQRGMRDVLLVEAPDGFIVQGLVMTSGGSGGWNEGMGTQVKETLTFLDEDIARFMDEAASRRGKDVPTAPHVAGHYENAFRVLGRYMDEQQPKDVFFFEQEGAFVVRLLHSTQAGHHHELAEFTRDDITELVARGPSLRQPDKPKDRRRPRHRHRHQPKHQHPGGGSLMNAFKTVAVALGITLAAVILIPLIILAGLFVWLKVTEEADEEILELDREGV